MYVSLNFPAEWRDFVQRVTGNVFRPNREVFGYNYLIHEMCINKAHLKLELIHDRKHTVSLLQRPPL